MACLFAPRLKTLLVLLVLAACGYAALKYYGPSLESHAERDMAVDTVDAAAELFAR
jgi:hypothetical protein